MTSSMSIEEGESQEPDVDACRRRRLPDSRNPLFLSKKQKGEMALCGSSWKNNEGRAKNNWHSERLYKEQAVSKRGSTRNRWLNRRSSIRNRSK
jgi:hypothetical protein